MHAASKLINAAIHTHTLYMYSREKKDRNKKGMLLTLLLTRAARGLEKGALQCLIYSQNTITRRLCHGTKALVMIFLIMIAV